MLITSSYPQKSISKNLSLYCYMILRMNQVFNPQPQKTTG